MNKHDAFNAIGYGLGIIQEERVRQVEKKGFTPESDQQYNKDELKRYARYWLTTPNQAELRATIINQLRACDEDGWGDEWFKYYERTPEQRLARAGALICAEIDRLHHASK